MAPSTSLPTPENAQSYTEMRGDVDAIGAHCQMAYCRKLDLLPFKCDSCQGFFCLDHRTKTAHKCPKESDSTKKNQETSDPEKPKRPSDERECADLNCKTMTSSILTTGVHCSTCNRQYCLKHRMQEDHNCKNLESIGARASNARDGMLAFARLKSWAEEKRKTELEKHKKKSGFWGMGSKSSNAAREALAEMNALKKAAKGNASIPQDKRIYLNVEASADTTKAKFPTGKFYYNKEWTVGRVLDVAAKALQVQNVNNRGGGEEDKLRVFHVEGGRLLKFSEKIGAPCANGNMIVLLRGVGSGEPDLIDL